MNEGGPTLANSTSASGAAAAHAKIIAPSAVPGDKVPVLKACGLGRRKSSGEDWLLRGICFAICPGDRLAVIGPSGAGKTLLLRALALLDPLDEGVIQWKGRGVSGNEVPAYRREVIYLHQRPALFEGSVEANLRYPFSLRLNEGRAFDEVRILDLLKSIGRAPSFFEKSSRDLSGGEAQIVALLRALQFDPSILLLDEPTTSLDERTARAIEELLGRWLSEAPADRASLWVSHDSDQVRRVADQCLRMQGGRLKPE
jgi:putative ABC transport system ATP-binding protein